MLTLAILIKLMYTIIAFRLYLACLHYNENKSREHARTGDGKKQYKVEFPKYKKGGYNYVHELLEKSSNTDSIPTSICEGFSHPIKDQAIKEHQTRFL